MDIHDVHNEQWAAANDSRQPSVLYRPQVYLEGNQWCACYGEFRTGVAGFGDSPELAMLDFDKAWRTKL